MKTNIYIRPETSTLYVWVSMFDDRKPVYNTEIQVDKKDWDKKKQRIKQAVTGADEINQKLTSYEKKVRAEYDRLTEQGIKPSFDLLKKVFVVKELEPAPQGLTFLKFMDDRIEYEYKEKFITKDRYNHEKASLGYLKLFAENTPFDFDSIDSDLYKKLEVYLSEVYKVKGRDHGLLNNSIGTCVSHWKKYCTIAFDSGLLKNSAYKKFPILKEKKLKKTRYSESDLLKVHKHKYDFERIRDAVDTNVLRYYAGGMRHGDTQLIRGKENIVDIRLKDGTIVKGLHFAQDKTEVPNAVILNDICLEILERRNYVLPKFTTSSECNKFMKMAWRIAGYKNKVVVIRHSGKKRVETVVEEWKLLGKSHTTRYSTFKLIIEKSNGNLYLAKEMLGQDDIRTTMGYAEMDENDKHEGYYKVLNNHLG